MRKVGGFMVDKERLARLEVLIDNTIEQLQSLKDTDINTLNELSEINELLLILASKNEELSMTNDKQNEQIAELINQIDKFNNRLKFITVVKNILKHPLFYIIIAIVAFLLSNNAEIFEFLKSWIM